MTMQESTGEKGVVLIALLWVLTAISILALSFARESRVEVVAARNARDLSDAYYIARAGISLTVYRLIERRLVPRVRQLELPGPPDPIDLGVVTGDFGDGSYELELQDESGKVNLNLVSEDQLRALVEASGIQKPDSDVIVDSVLDWRDADPAHRANGAEDDYYQSLPQPYRAKNGRMETVEELLLVRGVTPRYFYGIKEKDPAGNVVPLYGLSRYVTVYSNNNRININYAPWPVLMSVPGMTVELASLIVERRKTKPFENLQEITRDLPAIVGATALPYLSTEHTGTYTITARAHRLNSKVNRAIRAVVTIDPREPDRHKFLYWNENVPNL